MTIVEPLPAVQRRQSAESKGCNPKQSIAAGARNESGDTGECRASPKNARVAPASSPSARVAPSDGIASRLLDGAQGDLGLALRAKSNGATRD